jgi:acyl-CoA synthetase (AMP-forming)/AMP-acid ligase II
MMDWPLTVRVLAERAALLFPEKEIFTRTPDGLHRSTYGELFRRITRLANAFTALGVRPGDRVGTFAWNTYRHLELYLAAPSSGAVLHTVNIRLFPHQIAYIINHAADAVLFVDDSLVAQLEPLADRLATVRAFVVTARSPRRGSLPCIATRNCWRRHPTRTTGRRSTSSRPPACATRRAPPAIRRASSTVIARSCCSASRRRWPTRSG